MMVPSAEGGEVRHGRYPACLLDLGKASTFVWKVSVARSCSDVLEVDVQPISGLIHLSGVKVRVSVTAGVG
jgi:hypothetical protein